MTPTDVLQKLLTINKPVARLIYAGLGLVAAAAIAVTWIGNNPNAMYLAFYILGFAFLATIISFMVSNPHIRATLGWLLTIVFTLFLIGLVDSATGYSGRLAAPACYIRMFWEHPDACEARLFGKSEVAPQTDRPLPTFDRKPKVAAPIAAEASAGSPKPSAASDPELAPATVVAASGGVPAVHDGDVFLQFRPEIDRDRMSALAGTLSNMGWMVANADSGGQAYSHAPIENEVRYFHADARDTALSLAEDLTEAAGIRDVVVIDLSGSGLVVPADQIEIWIGH